MDEDPLMSIEQLKAEVSRIAEEPRVIDKANATHVVGGEGRNEFKENFDKATERRRKIAKGSTGAVRVEHDRKWHDKTFTDWPEGDYRIMVTNLPPTANDRQIVELFSRYKSFAKARVIHDSSGRNKQYAFVSLLDVDEYIDAMKNMNGAFLGNKRIQLQKSDWKRKSPR